MIFTISQSALARALQVASKAQAQNPTVPILGGVLLRAADGSLEIQSTDGVTSVRHVVPANVEEEGATVLSGRLLANAAKGLPDEAVTFESDGPVTRVSCAKSRLVLNALDPRDFPEFPEVEPDQSVTLPLAVAQDMVSKVRRSTSRDASRPTLAGVMVDADGGVVTMAATDSYRLAVCRAACEDVRFSALVDGATLGEAVGMASGDVTVGASESQVTVSFGGTTFVTRRIEGRFPKWEALLPRESATEVAVDADELAAAVRRVSVVAQSNPSVRLSAVRTLIGEVELHAVSQDRGESTEAVPAEVEGEDVVIHLNNRYLTDGVGHMSGEVTLRLNGPERPVVIETHDVVDFTYLLMPVRG